MDMYGLDSITIVIIVANVIISLKGFKDYGFFERYKFNIGAITHGEKFRMFTSGFLHADFSHLFFNLFTLYFFAPPVIYALGRFNFVLVYVVSLVFGSLLSFFMHKNNNHYSAIGASGAVTGVLYAAILIQPEMELYLMFIPIPIKGYIFGIGYLAYSIYGMKHKVGNIGHDAHFGGAIGGYVLTLLLLPSLFSTNFIFIILLALPIVALYILHKTGKLN